VRRQLERPGRAIGGPSWPAPRRPRLDHARARTALGELGQAAAGELALIGELRPQAARASIAAELGSASCTAAAASIARGAEEPRTGARTSTARWMTAAP
jgi:hypothetical protein